MIIAGVDEAGRGALAGPVVAGAVIISPPFSKGDSRGIFSEFNDSKQLSEKKREELFQFIVEHLDYGVGIVSAAEIDDIGIKKATEKAMNLAVQSLSVVPDQLLVDGRDGFKFYREIGEIRNKREEIRVKDSTFIPAEAGIHKDIDSCFHRNEELIIPSTDIIKGDEKEPCIAAASIIAKVTRDRLMVEYDAQFSGFGFAGHKGYGAKAHYDLLEQGTYCEIHRRTYDPLRTFLCQGKLF